MFPEVVGECRRMLPRRGIVCVCAGGARWCCPILWSKYDMDGVLSVAACGVVCGECRKVLPEARCCYNGVYVYVRAVCVALGFHGVLRGS